MKVAQLEFGKSYEDKEGKTERTLLSQTADGRVFYREGWFTESCSAQEFAAWAARPAGVRKFSGQKFLNWVRGPTL